ncbi:phasin family protein [Pseudorhizobium endolithicum]|uniref:Phasin family protein n=1 Tax=Pseudorhizobium endolithicum TaxID=1191678 RepID=A0ABM8PD19_9HYPH|nr:phasin family protein [Pseudorhizobium endolithicum]CAD6412497.1 phasin family protein [Rhizobium sp. Q54]CAD7023427.1 phasin family protein [Pseudorhizobium endolithicum]
MFNFDDASRKSSEVMEEMLKSYSEMAKGFQTIATEAGDYSRRSFQDMTSFMESLMSARGLEDAYQLQADYMKSSYDAFVAEAGKLSELYADLAKSAYASKARVPTGSSTAVVAAEAA